MLDVSTTASINIGFQHVGQTAASYVLLLVVVILGTHLLITKTLNGRVKFGGNGAKSVPGPRGIPVFGNMLSLGRSAPHISLTNLAKKFGNIFQIRLGSRPVLVLNGYDTIHKALVKQPVVFAGRPKLFTFQLLHSMSPNNTSMSFSSYDDRWKLHRKLAESSLRHFTAGSQVKFLESVVTKEASELINYITNMTDENNNDFNKEKEDLRNILRLAVSNIMCWFMFSKRHTYDDQELLGLLSISDRFSTATGNGNPVDFMPWLRFILTKTTTDFKNLITDFRGIIGGKLQKHHEQYEEGSERDIIDYLVTSGRRYGIDELAKVGLNEGMLMETCFDYFGAGFETIASTLEWCFMYMVANPDIQAEIHRELDTVVGRDRTPTLDDRDKLPLTQACILEVQRHASILPFTIPHSTTDDTVLDGYFVPKDTVVFVNLYSAQHDPDFWHDPEVFNPHRFVLPDGTLDFEKKHRVIPFGLGRRRCAGSDVARIELFLFFSVFLHRFSFEKMHDRELNLDGMYGLARKVKDFNLQLVRRN